MSKPEASSRDDWLKGLGSRVQGFRVLAFKQTRAGTALKTCGRILMLKPRVCEVVYGLSQSRGTMGFRNTF